MYLCAVPLRAQHKKTLGLGVNGAEAEMRLVSINVRAAALTEGGVPLHLSMLSTIQEFCGRRRNQAFKRSHLYSDPDSALVLCVILGKLYTLFLVFSFSMIWDCNYI